jgi:phage RecT family recombinase
MNTEITTYLHAPQSITKFADLLGNLRNAQAYIESVLIVVEGDEKLQTCTKKSVFIAALRAASLGLSCDKAMKQAWIIPYNVKVKKRNIMVDGKPQTIPDHWEWQAQFQPHYLGLYNLAVRTNKYRVIHVSPVYVGQRVLEDTQTGLHYIQDGNLITSPVNPNVSYTDVTDRRVKDLDRAGWIGYFETIKGFKKSVYMSCVEIEDYARRFVPGYLDEKGEIANPNWKGEKRAVMEMKTVFRQLANWMDKSGSENAKFAAALSADEQIIDASAEDPDDIVATTVTTEAINQPTQPDVKVEKPTDFISPLSQWAIKYAAAEWNISYSDATVGLTKYPATMTRQEFVNRVAGLV